MTDFETLFNDMFQSQQENEMDDENIGAVIRNPEFIVLLKAFYGSEEGSDKSIIYIDCLQHGFRLCDLLKAYCILKGKFADLSVSCPQIDESFDEKISENLVDLETQEQPITEYFLSVKLYSEENVYNGESSSIKIQSNLFCVSQIIEEIQKLGGFCAEHNNDLGLGSCLVGSQSCKLNIEKINIDEVEKTFEYNDYIISGKNDEELECLYCYLHKYAEGLQIWVMWENCLVRLRKHIANLEEVFKKVLIEKVALYSNIANKCKEIGIYSLRDLLEIRPSNLSCQELNELFSQILQIDTTKPAFIFNSWISRLKASELYVINKRYLGEELLTLEEVGAQCNVTRERIRQIEKKAITSMLSAKRSRYRELLLNQLKLLSPHKSYIKVSELEQLDIRRNAAIFLDKITGDIIYDNVYNSCFFSRASKSKLELCIEELPNEFTKTDLREYCILIADETKGAYTEDEVYDFILCKCRVYGEYITKSKITLKVVISVLMQKYFPDGINLYDEESLAFLREKAALEFDGFELAEGNRAIIGSLQRFCVPVDRGVWKYDTNQILISNELRNLIIQYIDEYRSPVVPIQAILDNFIAQFQEIEIYNRYSLHGQLKKILLVDYSINRDYVLKSNGSSFYDVVEAYIKQSVFPVTKRDIQENFPGITDIVISQVAATTRVINMNGYYVHLDNLNITAEEKNTLKTFVNKELTDGAIHHASAVFTKIKVALSGLFSRIGVLHYLQFYYLLHELFPGDYEYNRPFIAALGVKIISGEAQVINLIMQQDECSIATIRQYAKDIGTVIDRYIEFIDRNNESFIFKNRNAIITVAAVGLGEADFSGIDGVLSEFMGEANFRLLSEFYNYRELPDLKSSWNTWLLYSVIRKYSQEFKLVLTSNFLLDAKPVLVRINFNEQEIDLESLAELDSEDSEQSSDNDDDILDSFDYDDLE